MNQITVSSRHFHDSYLRENFREAFGGANNCILTFLFLNGDVCKEDQNHGGGICMVRGCLNSLNAPEGSLVLCNKLAEAFHFGV